MRETSRYVSDRENLIKATPGAVEAIRAKIAAGHGRSARLVIAGFG
jgi:hypothetical protein